MKGRSLFAHRSTLDTLARSVSSTRKRIDHTFNRMEKIISARRTAQNRGKRRWILGAVPAALAGAAGVAWFAYGKKHHGGPLSKMRSFIQH